MTPEKLRELVSYDPSTGSLTWKDRVGDGKFNSRLSGKPAFAQPSKGYLTGRMLGGNYKAHRVAWAIYHGEWPSSQLDHINGNRADNRISNLRLVSHAENAKNQRPKTSNKSGEPCVSWYARDRKWWVKITVDGRQKHIGYFDKIEDAVLARNAAWKENGFHENHGK